MAKKKAARTSSKTATPQPQAPQRDYVAEYTALQRVYEAFADRIDGLLIALLDKHSIAYHGTEKRSKTVDSFKEKIQRAGKQYEDPLKELTDLCGNRIILYYQEDIKRVCDIVREEFCIDDTRSTDKTEELETDRFGYMSVHLIASLSMTRQSLPEWENFKTLITEIQVRTVLQHAWAGVSHHLQYKQEADIPTKLRRRLNRLAGLFELADDEFSAIRQQRKQLKAEIQHDISSQNLSSELNDISVIEYLRLSATGKLIEAAATKAGINVDKSENEPHEVLEVARALELSTIKDLDLVLAAIAPFADEFFKNWAATVNKRYAEGIIIELTLESLCATIMVATRCEKKVYGSIAKKLGWITEFTQDVWNAGQSALKQQS